MQIKFFIAVFDSSVKFPNGLLYGSLYQMGNYDECVSVELPEKKIIGRYCLADVTIEANSTINVCIKTDEFIIK